MRRETAIALLLVGGSSGLGHLLSQRFGFDPLQYAARLGLTDQGTKILLSMGMITVLIACIARHEDEPTIILNDDLQPTASERLRRPPAPMHADLSPDPREIDLSGEWPQPRGPYPQAEDVK